MPYFLYEGRSVYNELREPKFHLLVFSDGKSKFQEWDAKIEKEYPGLIDFRVIPLYPRVAEVFGATRSFLVLLRPDNHVAMISREVSPDAPQSYLRRFFGL